MLDSKMKMRIDLTRSILIGKIPDPKSQIEQITTAMIYKFMCDMDKKSQEIGQNANFFINNLSDYTWNKLIDIKLSQTQRIHLYIEGIEKLKIALNIPEFFRNIFKNYHLPFSDERVFELFIKQINEFDYNNSETLGNAFEYLLSILSNQGDLGSFRTPRHIIDFIVSVINPKKNEKILDPACGTAGFLISALNHIIKTNSSNYKPEKEIEHIIQDNTGENITKKQMYAGDKLTEYERQILSENIVGYDIDTNMVKLALVNLYLHKVSNPQIYEYDTLTSDIRWNENYDVILANPPFMTPNGGITPHNKFRINSNRTELLFIDYITQHLNIEHGRAGIVVPEGVVFKSNKSYKNLRKNLIENFGLYAVVSLPSGTFQPYSTVKTCILLLDYKFSKMVDEILFVKVENDGFELGSQRKKHDKNDLPNCLNILSDWKNQKNDVKSSRLAFSVKKSKIIENDNYNLLSDCYCQNINFTNIKWKVVKLEEVCTVSCGDTAPQENDLFINGKYPFYRTSDVGFVHLSDNLLNVRDRLNDDGIRGLKLFPKGTILFPKSGASTFLNHRVIMGEDGYVSSHLATIVVDKSKVNEKYLYYLLTKINAKDITPYQAYPSLKISAIRQIKIPLPPLAIQEQIVTEIEEQQKMINKYKKSIEKINNKIESKISYILENKMDKFDEYVKTLSVSDEELNNEVKQALLDDGEDFIPECDFELNDEFENSLKDELSDF